MAEKRKQTPDLSQASLYPHRTWLAGVLEAGASMKLTIVRNHQNGHETPQARPEIAYGDTDTRRILKLGDLLGSTGKTRQSGLTHYAIVRGDRAALLAYAIRPDAPSRQTIISAFINWLQADYTEDRISIAEAVTGRRTLDPVQPGQYSRLVLNRDFVGGAIDCRGRISPIEHPDRWSLSFWTAHRLKMNSINKALLEALQQTHGGQLSQIIGRGDKRRIRGVETTFQHDGYEWVLNAQDTRQLLAWARPKLPIANAV